MFKIVISVLILLIVVPAFCTKAKMECAPAVENINSSCNCNADQKSSLSHQISDIQKVSEHESFLFSFYKLQQVHIPYEIANLEKRIALTKTAIKTKVDADTGSQMSEELLSERRKALLQDQLYLRDLKQQTKTRVTYQSQKKNLLEKIKSKAKEIRSRSIFNDCGFSDEEIFAISSYTTLYYMTINPILRKNDSKTVAQIQPFIDKLNSGLDKIAPYHGTVKRGVSLPREILKLYCKECIVTERAYVSAAIGGGFNGTEQLVIQSVNGKYIAPLSYSPDEDEVIFRPNTKFKIKDLGKTTDGAGKASTLISVDEIY